MTETTTDAMPAATRMGAVTLRVADLDAMTAYYRDAVALDVLAAAVRSVAAARPGSFTGSADHFVSEAFYFDDPEGNGVELYRDRDRADWTWSDGRVEMGIARLDPDAYLRAHLTPGAVDEPRLGGARVGHVHLQVGDIATATEFYVGVLGFDLTATYGAQAAFASAGGYHHHLGLNTWRSAGAGRRSAGLGLGRVEIALPTAADRGAVAERLRDRGIATADDGRDIAFEDPWGTRIVVTSGPGDGPAPA